MTDESEKAKQTASADCTNAINMAIKRLKMRGCGNLISYRHDGVNNNTGAPIDGSCSVYHVNGGGVKNCVASANLNDSCTTGPIGSVCASDGSIYIGSLAGKRLYASPGDTSSSLEFSSGHANTPTDANNGKSNTDTLVTGPGGFTYPGAAACRGLGSDWYLPAQNELSLMSQNSIANGGPLNLSALNIDTTGTVYMTSTQDTTSYSYGQQFSGSGLSSGGWKKIDPFSVRCFRQ